MRIGMGRILGQCSNRSEEDMIGGWGKNLSTCATRKHLPNVSQHILLFVPLTYHGMDRGQEAKERA